MSGFFGRTYSLRAGLPGEKGLQWDPPHRCSFEVLLTAKRSANKATISLYNIEAASIGQLEQEGAVVTLRAGFESINGQIFSGSISRRGVTSGRTDQTLRSTASTQDGATYVTTIEAGEGELAIQDTRGVWSFGRGVNNKTIFAAVADVLGFGLYDESLIDELSYSGGWVHHGRASGALDALVRDIGAQWSVQAGQLMVLKPGQNTNDEAYVIGPDSGLVGVAVATKDGVELKAEMLSPLTPGRKIIVESKAVNGIYRIDQVIHKGDFRGSDWHSMIKGGAVK